MTHSLDNVTFDHKSFLKTLTSKPGVYRMLNAKQQVIYVGKAKNLKKRVSSYFNRSDPSVKTQAMVARIHAIDITVTHTENEALLLENILIKTLKPQYNILYRDDKGYPYIYLSTHVDFPRLSYFRGTKKANGRYFGPYPSASAAKESLNLLQKLFPVRQCEDSFFKNRARPCLQYQIKRCTAPCVGLISGEQYAEDVRHASMFLDGKNSAVIDELVHRMEQAADQLAFEQAAKFRDQIQALRKVQERQYICGEQGHLDIVAGSLQNNFGCVQVFFIRDGHNLGNKAFYPKLPPQATLADMLSAFIAQYYLTENSHREMPAEILVNHLPEDHIWLETALQEQAGRKIAIHDQVRGERARWVKLAMINAETGLASYLANKMNVLARFEALQDALQLASMPQRLECFDISHTSGQETVASCVVMDTNGAIKSDYRRFNITDITPGDDYAAIYQAVTRRYRRLKESEGVLPDILVIDGGKGQLSQAMKVLNELQVSDVLLLGVAKGPERKPGMETLFLSGRPEPFILGSTSPALHLIQQIRDEAHRFAIQGHRNRRAKKQQSSPLEDIPGLGPKRRQLLLKQFGGWQGVSRAGVDDLMSIKGISKQLAQKIYEIFHSN